LPYKQTATLYTVIRIQVTEADIVGALVDPDNITRYDTCAGRIRTGVVKEIRNYTYNVSIPGFSSYSNITSFVKDTGPSETEYSYVVNAVIEITKKRPVILNPQPPPVDYKDRQKDYYQRDVDGNIVYEYYNATGDEELTVYGSWDRALMAARDIVLPNDYFIGDYVTYHINGYPAKTYSFTYSPSTGSVLQGYYYEYFNNGFTRVEGRFHNGYLDGFYREYYYDGTVKCQGTLLNGKLNGEYTQWDALGNRIFRAFYVEGTLDNSYVLVY
jgi:antitoxin component YwqK of YwqJK toxin-antitoxin module